MREKPLVLIVDDEEVFLEIASVKLQASGFETLLANEVQDALVKAETCLPDLVLSDVYMPPGISGFEFALELRRNPRTREIKIAFFTSLRDPWAELRDNRKEVMKQLGDVVFFSKTDDVDNLAAGVIALVKKGS